MKFDKTLMIASIHSKFKRIKDRNNKNDNVEIKKSKISTIIIYLTATSYSQKQA